MSERSERRARLRAAEEQAEHQRSALTAMGLEAGAVVRFRRRDAERWHLGRAIGVERDGSLSIADDKRAMRAIPVDLVEVKGKGPRGGTAWEPLPERMTRIEQLRLL